MTVPGISLMIPPRFTSGILLWIMPEIASGTSLAIYVGLRDSFSYFSWAALGVPGLPGFFFNFVMVFFSSRVIALFCSLFVFCISAVLATGGQSRELHEFLPRFIPDLFHEFFSDV